MHVALIVSPSADADPDETTYAHRLAAAMTESGHAATVAAEDDATAPGAVRCAVVHRADVGTVARAAAAGHAVASSKTAADALAAAGAVRADAVVVIAPGSDVAARVMPRAGGPCRILTVANPRVAVLIRALARLGDLDWVLASVGALDDALPAEMAARVRVIAQPAWDEADVFAVATGPDGLGLGVLDALRRGLPVGVAGGTAARAPVTAEAGVACAANDAEGLSKALRRLIFDADLRAHMAEAAWQAGQALPEWPAQSRLLAAFLAGTAGEPA